MAIGVVLVSLWCLWSYFTPFLLFLLLALSRKMLAGLCPCFFQVMIFEGSPTNFTKCSFSSLFPSVNRIGITNATYFCPTWSKGFEMRLKEIQFRGDWWSKKINVNSHLYSGSLFCTNNLITSYDFRFSID